MGGVDWGGVNLQNHDSTYMFFCFGGRGGLGRGGVVGILTDSVGFRSCVFLGFQIRSIGLHEKRGFYL